MQRQAEKPLVLRADEDFIDRDRDTLLAGLGIDARERLPARSVSQSRSPGTHVTSHG
jgi:hypothetical protein